MLNESCPKKFFSKNGELLLRIQHLAFKIIS